MKKISAKYILIAFLILFLLSRSGKIRDSFSGIHDIDTLLTLAPLRECSEAARYVVTLLLLALAFVTVFVLLKLIILVIGSRLCQKNSKTK